MKRSWKRGIERPREAAIESGDMIRRPWSEYEEAAQRAKFQPPQKRPSDPNEIFFITEIAEGEGGAEGEVDVEAFYDAESAAERLDFRAKDLFNDLLDDVVHMQEEGEDEHGWTKEDYLNALESARALINQGEYQGALDILSELVMHLKFQAAWTTELLHTEELK